MSPERRQRRGHRGQALVETCIVFVVLVTLVTGAYAVGTFAKDQNSATVATRSGARFAAEMGNYGWKSGQSTTSTAKELPVVTTVCRLAAQMPFVAALEEVDIYQPTRNSDGSFANGVGGDPADVFNLNNDFTCNSITVTGAATYTLDKRNQTHPNESQIGVRLRYQYTSPTPFYKFTFDASVYTVMTLAPKFT